VIRLESDLAERVLASHPLPVADAVAALLAAEGPFEARDRVVEVFRAELRMLGAIVLAARLQLGAGPGPDSAQVPELLRTLRARGLTDGQWAAVLREVLRPWSGARAGHPLRVLVELVHARKSELVRLFDELLVMRKSETVAHGATGTRAGIEEILARRVPQLARTLELLDPLWSSVKLCAPVAPTPEEEEQAAWLLMGTTPARGRFRRIGLGARDPLPSEEVLLVDESGRPLVALHPVALLKRPSPGAVPEVFLLDGGSKRGAVYVAFPSMSEHRERDAWSAIEGALTDEEQPNEDAAKLGSERPYRGLSAFGPDDAALFFGREEQAQSLANRVRRDGFVTVTGPSGSGKTSLLSAGVLPLLRDTLTTFVRPGLDPVTSLATRLAAPLGRERAELEALCRRDPRALARLVDASAHDAEKLHVIVVDQAEEMLTLCRDAPSRLAFARVLAEAADPHGSVRVVLSVREDFFARIATVAPLAELYSRSVEVVTSPDRTSLFRTVVAPAQLFGYAFEDEELVTAMVDAVEAAPAALALHLFCPDRLWEQRDRRWKRLTWDAYRAMGGVAGALASHADHVLGAMSASERATTRALFLRLVSGERTRSVAPRDELLEALRDPEAGARALDALVAARLLSVADDPAGRTTVEIVHEALITHWAQLDRWLGEDEEGQKLAHSMRQAARDWNARGRPRSQLFRGELLDDLRRYRKRSPEPLAGLEAAFADASEAEARRGRRVRVALVASALALSTAFSAFALWQWQRTEAARVDAERARVATAKEKVNVEVRGLIAEARAHEPKGRSGQALALLRAASSLEEEQGADRSSALSLELERLARSGAGGVSLVGHGAPVRRACFAPGSDRVVTAAVDESVRVWEGSTGRLLATVKAPAHAEIRGLACSPDGRSFFAAGADERGERPFVKQHDLEDGAELRAFEGLAGTLSTIELVDDGAELVVFGGDGTLWVIEVSSGALLRTIGGPGTVIDYDVTADGRAFAVAVDSRIELWSRESDAPLWTHPVEERIAGIAISDDGARVAFSTLDGGLVPVLDGESGELLRRLKPAGTLGVAHVAFAPEGRTLVTSGPRGLDVWDLEQGKRRHNLRTDAQRTTFFLSPDGRSVVTLRAANLAELWDLESGARLATLGGHDAEIEHVAFSENASQVITTGWDKVAIVHDVAASSVLSLVAAQDELIRASAISPDGRFVATAAGRGLVRVLSTDSLTSDSLLVELAAGKGPATTLGFAAKSGSLAVGHEDGELRVIELPSGRVMSSRSAGGRVSALAWTPTGQLVVATGAGALSLLDAASGAPRALATVPGKPNLVAVEPTGERVAVGSFDGTVWVVPIPGEGQPIVLAPSVGPVTAMTFSPTGPWLVVADNQGARWFDTRTWQHVEVVGHEQAITAVAFTTDGSLLATGSADGTARLHTRDDRPSRLLSGHAGAITDLTFSQDAARLLTASEDGTARVWDVSLGAPLDVLEPFGGAVRVARFIADDRVAAIGSLSVALLASRPADRAATRVDSGARTNLRVCRDSFAVVVVASAPATEVWAPAASCAGAVR
jgi:WD40 repeat protein